MRYADAGVNIAVADDAKNRIRHLATRTFTNGVLGGIGSFGALFELDKKKFKEPILVSSADGVGTKLKVAIAMNVHSTVGGDLVNHCVNDILVQGAEPLFFLDYLALGKMDPHVVEQLVDGMSRACRKAGCALIGGETAEMPGFYGEGEYDLAGFIVGAVEKKKLLTGKNVKPGDTLLALPSAGLHTNGYSLARKLVFEVAKLKPDTYVAEVGNKIGAELLKPHLCYAPALRTILANGWVSALAHITGGGIPGNLAARAAGGRESADRSGVVAGAADFQVSGESRENGFRRAAGIVQPRRGHDSGGAVGVRQKSGSGPEAPPRKVLPDWPHRTRRHGQSARGLLRRAQVFKTSESCWLAKARNQNAGILAFAGLANVRLASRQRITVCCACQRL